MCISESLMASESLSKCARCASEASLRCTGCLHAPEYLPGDAASTIYCSRECQKEHWQIHGGRCLNLQRRKKLLRAARLLKASLITFREVLYDVGLLKVELRDGALKLHQKPRSLSTLKSRSLFPDHLTSTREHKEAALAHNSCTTAMALLGRLTRKLLQGQGATCTHGLISWS
jgi:hypothetical protein